MTENTETKKEKETVRVNALLSVMVLSISEHTWAKTLYNIILVTAHNRINWA